MAKEWQKIRNHLAEKQAKEKPRKRKKSLHVKMNGKKLKKGAEKKRQAMMIKLFFLLTAA